MDRLVYARRGIPWRRTTPPCLFRRGIPVNRYPVWVRRRPWRGLPAVVGSALLASVWALFRIAGTAGPPHPPFATTGPAAGIDFRHQRGASDKKHLVETVGSGCALFDYDNDGWLDILMINGGLTPDTSAAGPVRHALYRNLGNGRFREVTAKAGLEGNGSYGMGVAVGRLRQRRRPGRLHHQLRTQWALSQQTGTGPSATSRPRPASAVQTGAPAPPCSTWDNDGDLDLYVTNYLETSFETSPHCELKNIRTYCYPGHYDGVGDRLYQNLGGGRFRDVSEASGILNPEGKGLGVVAADFDDDGWMDLYVANDTVRNFHYQNNRRGGFEDMTLLSGTGYNEEANPEAGMGTDAADYDGDGLMDIVVTNYDMEDQCPLPQPPGLAVHR